MSWKETLEMLKGPFAEEMLEAFALGKSSPLRRESLFFPPDGLEMLQDMNGPWEKGTRGVDTAQLRKRSHEFDPLHKRKKERGNKIKKNHQDSDFDITPKSKEVPNTVEAAPRIWVRG